MKIVKMSTFIIPLGFLCIAAGASVLHHETNLDNSDCVCLPKSSNPDAKRLPDIIDGSRNGLDRLVTYYYINPQTKDVTAYTPNVQKQQSFPDLTFDEGDEILPVQPEDNVNNFVISNSNKVERPSGYTTIHQDTPVPDVKELLTIPQHTENISEPDIITQDVSPVIEHLKETVVETHNAVDELIKPASNGEVHVHSDANIDMIENMNQGTYGQQNLLNHLVPGQDTEIITLQNINQTPQNIADMWQTNAMNNIYKWNDYLQYNKGRPDIQNVQAPGYLKFDQWYQQQMESSINKQIQNGVNFPGDDVLKSLVYKYLFQNGIILMDNGILKTHQGDTVNLSNLKLQPVLIGLSLGYNYPTAGVQSKIVTPSYDAIALYSNHPQKILGIIPIGSDYSADAMGYTTMNLNKLYPGLLTSTVLKTQCVNGKCYTSTVAKDVPLLSRSSQEKEAPKVSNGRSAQETNKEFRMKLYGDSGEPLGILKIKQSETTKGKKKSKRIPIINDILAKLYNLLLGDEVNKKSGKKTPLYDIRNVEDEGPDFRIVGGSAATGSGTPVSSRGRSAIV